MLKKYLNVEEMKKYKYLHLMWNVALRPSVRPSENKPAQVPRKWGFHMAVSGVIAQNSKEKRDSTR